MLIAIKDKRKYSINYTKNNNFCPNTDRIKLKNVFVYFFLLLGKSDGKIQFLIRINQYIWLKFLI